MHKLTGDFDGQLFVGRDLSALTFTSNTVHFAFDSDLLITAYTTYRYRITTGGQYRDERAPVASTEVTSIIGETVLGAVIARERDFTLVFNNGREISYIDDSDSYESYMIKIADKEFVV